MLERKIEERRRGEAYHEDFLQHLLKDNGNGCSDEVPPLTDAEIKDNILTMIIAGHSKRTAPSFIYPWPLLST